jgi:hypothetical protein
MFRMRIPPHTAPFANGSHVLTETEDVGVWQRQARRVGYWGALVTVPTFVDFTVLDTAHQRVEDQAHGHVEHGGGTGIANLYSHLAAKLLSCAG